MKRFTSFLENQRNGFVQVFLVVEELYLIRVYFAAMFSAKRIAELEIEAP